MVNPILSHNRNNEKLPLMTSTRPGIPSRRGFCQSGYTEYRIQNGVQGATSHQPSLWCEVEPPAITDPMYGCAWRITPLHRLHFGRDMLATRSTIIPVYAMGGTNLSRRNEQIFCRIVG
jgi:hypothetical protein